MTSLQQRLDQIPADRLRGMRRGLEKESLRALAGGGLALTPHPLELGSALTHPRITTDYSESQLELITGVHASADACMAELQQLHQVVARTLQAQGEHMWVSSMPCGLPTDETIPLGRYGSSNVGRAKSVYRMGLGHRYGRRMQTISGIHYNWSLPGLDNTAYFGLIRNFRRQAPLLLYLFGASPSVCATFVEGRTHQLQALTAGTLHMPHGTSLRMGRLGYQSEAQASLSVSYNSLEQYGATLQDALTRPYPPYEQIGIRNIGGEYNQLATTLLQIENEFYGTIRPKRVTASGQRPLHALRAGGVEYIEVRCMDLDPFEPLGIAAPTLRFLDVFLLHCLLDDSPPDSPDEIAALGRNQHAMAERGREAGLRLELGGQPTDFVAWGRDMLQACAPIAARLDALDGGNLYQQALEEALARLSDAQRTPSARVLAAMTGHGNSFVRFVREQSQQTQRHLLALDTPPDLLARFERMAADSVAEQRRIELADTEPFETFRQRYLAPSGLLV